jgi:hypothetical protein
MNRLERPLVFPHHLARLRGNTVNPEEEFLDHEAFNPLGTRHVERAICANIL